MSLQTIFWLSTVYGQKLGPILQSTGFENAQLQSTEKSIAPPSDNKAKLCIFETELHGHFLTNLDKMQAYHYMIHIITQPYVFGHYSIINLPSIIC